MSDPELFAGSESGSASDIQILQNITTVIMFNNQKLVQLFLFDFVKKLVFDLDSELPSKLDQDPEMVHTVPYTVSCPGNGGCSEDGEVLIRSSHGGVVCPLKR